MKVCANCKKEFKSWTTINDKKVSLSQRKYCLECVPYGKRTMYRNKKVIPGLRFKEREFICKTCGRLKKNKDRNNECSSCRSKKLRIERKTEAINANGGKCQKCGYNRYIGALDFHHTGEEEKEKSLSRLWLYSPKTIEKELKKCILVCSNCHREIHAGLIS